MWVYDNTTILVRRLPPSQPRGSNHLFALHYLYLYCIAHILVRREGEWERASTSMKVHEVHEKGLHFFLLRCPFTYLSG